MTTVERTAFADLEVVELLADRPDLLAIADAVAATQSSSVLRRRRRTPIRLVAVAAVLGLAVAVALVSPWSGGSGLVDRALAAIGEGDVVHVVEVADLPGRSLVDLQTGVESPVVATREIWFDGERGVLRSVQRIGGTVTYEALETPEGSWTDAGRVYTCAWIAAHPVEATKARVSCNPSGENGTVPRHVPEPRPTLPPALAGFVTGYQGALERGEATRDGSGVVDGRAVEWLRFVIPRTAGSGPGERVERAAVDAETLEPVRVETLVAGKLVDAATISVAETLDRADVSFARPKLKPPGTEPVSARIVDEREVSVADADAALQRRLLDAGATLAGLPRSTVTLETVVSSYGRESSRAPTRAVGVEMLYGGPVDPRLQNDYVLVKQSLEPLLVYRFGFMGSGPAPAAGSLAVTPNTVSAGIEAGKPARPVGTLFIGQMLAGGVYVTIEATSKPLLVEAARTLHGVATP